MKFQKHITPVIAGLLAVAIVLPTTFGLLATPADAASSSEIRKQINALKEEKKQIQEKIQDVKDEYQQNEDEMADLMARKSAIEQEVQLLNDQVTNINSQISAYNTLIADKQDELDNAEGRYDKLNEENRVRIRTMEEEGSISYWEVLFRAKNFSDLLDRLNMVEEIAASDNRRLQELDEAAKDVSAAQDELQSEKDELEAAKEELDQTQTELDQKNQEAVDLLQELLSKADDLEALELEYMEQEQNFLTQIAAKEVEFTAAKQAEWAAYMATYVAPTRAAGGTTGDSSSGGSSGGSSSGGSSGGSSSGGWVIPVSYTSITSPFGNRTSPTAGASSNHMGMDLDATTGDPVYATKAGIVVVAGYGSAAGNYVKIDHQDGFTSIYMHLNSYCVSSGQMVSAGQKIGEVGATGVATGDHLHFGITQNGVYVNPANYVNLN